MADPELDDLTTRFRDAMATVCTPVAVVTAMDGDRPHGTTVSAFSSLSMTPPSFLVSLDHGSELLGLILSSGILGINVLGSEHSSLATKFARKDKYKFEGVDWTLERGVPRIDGAAHWVAAEVMHTAPVADHTVVFGRVLEVSSEPMPPLTYHDRVFGTHSAL